jgi:hypothetical protein
MVKAGRFAATMRRRSIANGDLRGKSLSESE